MNTPTIYELLDDPVYRAYVKTIPRLAPNLTHGEPWQVWVLTKDEKWRSGKFSAYPDAWKIVVRAIRTRAAIDVAVVSRRQFFTPPQGFTWPIGYQWCPRCRRPTKFRLATRATHHALRTHPALSTEDRKCCVYCGIRQVAVPNYERNL